METKTINASLLQKMFIAGAKNLEAHKELINELNVFPVPDGDTGTNMTLTIMSAAKAVAAVEEVEFNSLAKAISSGSLRGARGNSGVILSQLCRGFTKEMKDIEEITSEILSRACVKAVETAYKAVMKPKEGTILTVAKGMSDKACELMDETEDLENMISKIIKYGNEVLDKTPEMLPVLKQAGVVDSGGKGLMTFIEGAFEVLQGKEVDLTLPDEISTSSSPASAGGAIHLEETEIKFGYCTEFIIDLDKPASQQTLNDFEQFLESIGDSIVFVPDEELIKVHVHTNDPGEAISRALKIGPLSKMKIDNMRMEHHERVIKNSEKLAKQQKAERASASVQPAEKKKYGFISVSVGEGLDDIFHELNVDYIISGGQTMNPSTEDILDAVDKVNADTIFVLPNNKNIILAANQAVSLVEDKKLVVVPSKTVPQGIAAMIGFVEEASTEENLEAMTESMEYVKSGEVTYAVRDTNIDGVDIKEGNIMSIGDDGILAVGEDLDETTMEAIEKMKDEDSEIVSLYYGQDVDEKQANELKEKISERFDDLEIEMYAGGQPVYYYIISVE